MPSTFCSKLTRKFLICDITVQTTQSHKAPFILNLVAEFSFDKSVYATLKQELKLKQLSQ